MYNLIIKMRAKSFDHHSLKITENRKIIFSSFSKRNFYLRFQISGFVLLNDGVPINPFMNFDYNLAGLVDTFHIRVANNSMIQKSDELWVFGEVSDGVLIEIYLAKKFNKPVRYFKLSDKINEIIEIREDDVILEDVSDWVWEWILEGKNLERWHPRLRLKKTYPLIYPAYSKRNFFWQMQISKFCLEKKTIPLNPFMLFRYFLGDLVPRKTVYAANNNLVRLVDEIWVFGQVSDGVLSEVMQKKSTGGVVKFFNIIDGDPVAFRTMVSAQVTFEDVALENFKSELS